VNKQLQFLVELQKLDTVILSTRMRIDSIPAAISSREGPLRSAEAAYERAKQNHAAIEKKKKDRERDIEDLNEKIKKLGQRTAGIKNNKEYQAHLKEIERAEKDVKAAEDEILSSMDSLENSSRLLKEETSRIAEEKVKIEAIKKELEKEVLQGERELKKLKVERKGIVSKIEGDIYNRYMTLLKANRGLAVVEAKDEICLGCYLHVPPQMFVELKDNSDIVECPQCMRILYYETPAEEVPAQQ